jgi:sulfur carrier protein
MPMNITLNGKSQTISDHTTVSELLSQNNIESTHVVVEINENIIPRPTYDSHQLQTGDRTEILYFVGGG